MKIAILVILLCSLFKRFTISKVLTSKAVLAVWHVFLCIEKVHISSEFVKYVVLFKPIGIDFVCSIFCNITVERVQQLTMIVCTLSY